MAAITVTTSNDLVDTNARRRLAPTLRPDDQRLPTATATEGAGTYSRDVGGLTILNSTIDNFRVGNCRNMQPAPPAFCGQTYVAPTRMAGPRTPMIASFTLQQSASWSSTAMVAAPVTAYSPVTLPGDPGLSSAAFLVIYIQLE